MNSTMKWGSNWMRTDCACKLVFEIQQEGIPQKDTNFGKFFLQPRELKKSGSWRKRMRVQKTLFVFLKFIRKFGGLETYQPRLLYDR